MTPTTIPENDKDYILLNAIDDQQDISQRELSHKTGLSLGSVNLLLQKMIREGLIKMETMPANRVIYMLTPKGIAEKAAKTIRYIRHHYHVIQSTKERIWAKLDQCRLHYEEIIICLPPSEIKSLVVTAIDEYSNKKPGQKIKMIEQENLGQLETRQGKMIILYLPEESSKFLLDLKNQSIVAEMLL